MGFAEIISLLSIIITIISALLKFLPDILAFFQ